MNVVDLLPDHPTAPQRNCFETLLPDLMTFLAFRKSEPSSALQNCLGSVPLQIASKLPYAAIAWIHDQMKVIRHQNIGY
jgi:Ca2+/Na+ antiporter